jgi:monoamine oxidase
VLDDWLAELQRSKSVSKFKPDEIFHAIAGELLIDTGVPLSMLSSKYGMEPGVGEGDRWIVGGYSQLFDFLSRDLDIHLGSVVKVIEYSSTGVIVHAEKVDKHSGEVATLKFEADCCVCTVPIAVLQQDFDAGGIIFDPPLPELHKSAMDLLVTGRVEKIALMYEKRWWPTADQSGGYIRVYDDEFGNVSEWLDCTDAFGGVPVISGIFSGPWLEEIWAEGASDSDIANRVSEILFKAVHTKIGKKE